MYWRKNWELVLGNRKEEKEKERGEGRGEGEGIKS